MSTLDNTKKKKLYYDELVKLLPADNPISSHFNKLKKKDEFLSKPFLVYEGDVQMDSCIMGLRQFSPGAGSISYYYNCHPYPIVTGNITTKNLYFSGYVAGNIQAKNVYCQKQDTKLPTCCGGNMEVSDLFFINEAAPHINGYANINTLVTCGNDQLMAQTISTQKTFSFPVANKTTDWSLHTLEEIKNHFNTELVHDLNYGKDVQSLLPIGGRIFDFDDNWLHSKKAEDDFILTHPNEVKLEKGRMKVLQYNDLKALLPANNPFSKLYEKAKDKSSFEKENFFVYDGDIQAEVINLRDDIWWSINYHFGVNSKFPLIVRGTITCKALTFNGGFISGNVHTKNMHVHYNDNNDMVCIAGNLEVSGLLFATGKGVWGKTFHFNIDGYAHIHTLVNDEQAAIDSKDTAIGKTFSFPQVYVTEDRSKHALKETDWSVHTLEELKSYFNNDLLEIDQYENNVAFFFNLNLKLSKMDCDYIK